MKYKFTLTRTVTDIAEVEIDANSHDEAARKLKSQVWGKRVQWIDAEDDIHTLIETQDGKNYVSDGDLSQLTGEDIREALSR